MRLNSAIRAEITRGAFKVLYERREVLNQREHALCIKCYQAALPVAFRNKLDALQDAAKELNHNKQWLNFASVLNFNVGGQYHRLALPPGSDLPVPRQYFSAHDKLGQPIDRETHS
jgi:hypothetical protein